VPLAAATVTHIVPSPGIYAVMTLPVLSLTLAIFLSPEFGFLGLVVPTLRHTPLSSGRSFNCGDLSFRAFCAILPWRNTCINVHLWARDDGAGRIAKAGATVSKAVAAKEGRIGRARAYCAVERNVGLTRRLRNVTGILRCGRRWMIVVDKSSRCDISAD
jgi:hypothetical protein